VHDLNKLTITVVEAEREAIVEAEETTALRARFKVTLAELQKAKTEWKE
jgi:hypothetical protein